MTARQKHNDIKNDHRATILIHTLCAKIMLLDCLIPVCRLWTQASCHVCFPLPEKILRKITLCIYCGVLVHNQLVNYLKLCKGLMGQIEGLVGKFHTTLYGIKIPRCAVKVNQPFYSSGANKTKCMYVRKKVIFQYIHELHKQIVSTVITLYILKLLLLCTFTYATTKKIYQ